MFFSSWLRLKKLVVRLHPKRWQLSCHHFWCKHTLHLQCISAGLNNPVKPWLKSQGQKAWVKLEFTPRVRSCFCSMPMIRSWHLDYKERKVGQQRHGHVLYKYGPFYKQCGSRSVAFWRSHLFIIHTVFYFSHICLNAFSRDQLRISFDREMYDCRSSLSVSRHIP